MRRDCGLSRRPSENKGAGEWCPHTLWGEGVAPNDLNLSHGSVEQNKLVSWRSVWGGKAWRVHGRIAGVGCALLPMFPRGSLVETSPTYNSCQQTQIRLHITQGVLAAACLGSSDFLCSEVSPWLHRTVEKFSRPSSWNLASVKPGAGGCAMPKNGVWTTTPCVGCQTAPGEDSQELRHGDHHTREVRAPGISSKHRDLCKTLDLFCLRGEGN